MSKARGFITARIVTGMLIVVPAYLAVLLLAPGHEVGRQPGAAGRSPVT